MCHPSIRLGINDDAYPNGIKQNDLGFRLAIDRAFHVKGAGLVVTGTALSGSIKVGDSLNFVSHNKLKQGQTLAKTVRIKGLHA